MTDNKSLGPDLKTVYVKNGSEKEWRDGREKVLHHATSCALTHVKHAYVNEKTGEVRIRVGTDTSNLDISFTVPFYHLQIMMAAAMVKQIEDNKDVKFERDLYKNVVDRLSPAEASIVRNAVIQRYSNK